MVSAQLAQFRVQEDSFPLSTEGFVEAHWKSYACVVNDCCVALSTVWTKVGLSLSDVESQLNTIAEETTAVWDSAVRLAEQQKHELEDVIRCLEVEISVFETQLGESFKIQIPTTTVLPLRKHCEMINKLRDECKEVKQARIAEFKSVLSQIESIRAQFGQPLDEAVDFDDPKSNLTKESLEFLKCDLDSFCNERTRRLQILESLWQTFKTVCSEIGEDPHEVIKTVHSGMESLDQRFLETPSMWQHLRSPCLSQEIFTLVEEKLSALQNERTTRENNLVYKKETLVALWDALQIPKDNLERSILTRLMESPARLHQKTLQRVEHEIHRQESAQARVLKVLISEKLTIIGHLCETGRLELPEEARRIIEKEEIEHEGKENENLGHNAEALNTLNRLIVETENLLERRVQIISFIEEFEHTRTEVSWLESYEQDEDRYKGRDCSKKLKRAIKAGKLRDRMPSALATLQEVLFDWERRERTPFMIEGVNYRVEVLDFYEMGSRGSDSKASLSSSVRFRQISVGNCDSDFCSLPPTPSSTASSKSSVMTMESQKKKMYRAIPKPPSYQDGRTAKPHLMATGFTSRSKIKFNQPNCDPSQQYQQQQQSQGSFDQRQKSACGASDVVEEYPDLRKTSAIPQTPKSKQKNENEVGLFLTPSQQQNKTESHCSTYASQIMEEALSIRKKTQRKKYSPSLSVGSISMRKSASNPVPQRKGTPIRQFAF